MKLGASIFSLVFSIIAVTSLFWGVLLMIINPKEKISKVYLLISITLSIWALGFSFSNSALDINVAVFFRRVAAVGWVSIVSITLHFILLMTQSPTKKRQPWIFYIIHIPALVNLYIFSISTSISVGQYQLIESDFGWINQTVNNAWDFVYYVYYVVYIILGLIMLFKWKSKLVNKRKIKQANLIIYALIVSIIVGTLTDIVLSTFFKSAIPQSAPIFMLIPLWAMYHSVRRYNIVNYQEWKKEEILATEHDKKRIFQNTMLAFCFGGILNFVIDYAKYINGSEQTLSTIIFKSSLFFVIGAAVYFIQKINNEQVKEALTMTILVLSIPIINFIFIDYASITIWAFPAMIILTSLIFNKKTLLISTTLVSIITQRLIWIIKPNELVVVGEFDYGLRMIFFISMFVIGYYVNEIYNTKIKEIKDNTYQIKFQKMVLDISLDFLGLNIENYNEKTDNLLEKTGLFFESDRTYLFTIDHEKNTMTYSNEWCNTGINAEVKTINEIPLDTFPWWIEQLSNNKIVHIANIDDMEVAAEAEKKQLQRQNVKSLIAVPIEVDNKLHGFIGLDSVVESNAWADENIESLRIVSNILASGFLQLKAHREINHMAYYDSLTNLPNRILFDDRVRQSIKLAKRTGSFTSIIFIDLDGFKSVNDSMGHAGGDALLKKVSDELVKLLRKSDTVARFGGDEFMLLLNSINDYSAVSLVADKVMKLFSKSMVVNDQEFYLSASAGIAIYPVDGENPDTLIKNADIAMYKAKLNGKNQYALCSSEMKAEVQLNIELSNYSHRALERGEFVLHYQPQIDLLSGTISGFEALLRWNHPTRGFISPNQFIPILEKNGLINSVGEWVLKNACLQNKKWQDMGLPKMIVAINLSATQIVNPDVVDAINRIINDSQLEPKYIELEITESVTIKETNFVAEVLEKLKKIGVSVAIDDFGTEYSSLTRLKDLPIDRIKVDRQFIQGLENNEKDRAIATVIINLAKNLNLNVLAEGVETEKQVLFLKQLKCDTVQGFYYYKPMLASQLEKILKKLSPVI